MKKVRRASNTTGGKEVTIKFNKKQWTAYKVACLLKKTSPKKQLKTLAVNWTEAKLKGVF